MQCDSVASVASDSLAVASVASLAVASVASDSLRFAVASVAHGAIDALFMHDFWAERLPAY